MSEIYIFSKKPVTGGIDDLPHYISIEEEIAEGNILYKLTPFLNGGRFLHFASEFIFLAIIHNIVDGKLCAGNYSQEFSDREISEFLRRKLSAYLFITGGRERIHDKTMDLLEKGSIINIEGVINFSLKDMSADISAFFDLMFYEYKIQKQYDAFISLVRNYVELERPRETETHIVFKKKGFLLYDEKKSNITFRALKAYKADTVCPEGTQNDFLISSLLYFMPKKIVIHVKRGSETLSVKRIIDTIKTIFEERVIDCTFHRCEFCACEEQFDELSNYICENINV